MRAEIEAASNFITSLPSFATVPGNLRERFRQTLIRLMAQKFHEHWNVDQPMHGNGFRSIMTYGAFVDPLLTQAAQVVGIQKISALLPTDLVVWVDPFEVSYRIGEFGSVCTLYQDSMRHRHALGRMSPPKYVVQVN